VLIDVRCHNLTRHREVSRGAGDLVSRYLGIESQDQSNK
jgi:hypothetical protein